MFFSGRSDVCYFLRGGWIGCGFFGGRPVSRALRKGRVLVRHIGRVTSFLVMFRHVVLGDVFFFGLLCGEGGMLGSASTWGKFF